MADTYRTTTFKRRMKRFKEFPQPLLHVLDKKTCSELQKIAKSVYMTKFYNKRKMDLILQIIDHITTAPHYYQIASKLLKKNKKGKLLSALYLNGPEVEIKSNVLNLNKRLKDVQDADDLTLATKIVDILSTHASAQEEVFNHLHPNCPNSTVDESVVYGRSETGCKPGWKRLTGKTGTCRYCVKRDDAIVPFQVIDGQQLETNADLITSELQDQLADDNQKLKTAMISVRADMVPRQVNGTTVDVDRQMVWFTKYVEGIQNRMVRLLEAEFQDTIRFYDVDNCNDTQFEKEVMERMRKSTWTAWFLEQVQKGVQIIGYVLKVLVKMCMVLVSTIRKVTAGGWTMASALAHTFVFHPRQLRIIMFIVRRTKKRMCRWFGDYMVRDKWVDALPQGASDEKKGMFGDVAEFLSGTGVLDMSRLKHAILTSDVVENAVENSGKYATMAVQGLLGSFGPLGSALGAVAGIVTDVTMNTLAEASKLELEAQMWSDDFTSNMENFLSIVNPVQCLRDMPAVHYHFCKGPQSLSTGLVHDVICRGGVASTDNQK